MVAASQTTSTSCFSSPMQVSWVCPSLSKRSGCRLPRTELLLPCQRVTLKQSQAMCMILALCAAEKYFHPAVTTTHYELYKDATGFSYQVPEGTEIDLFRKVRLAACLAHSSQPPLLTAASAALSVVSACPDAQCSLDSSSSSHFQQNHCFHLPACFCLTTCSMQAASSSLCTQQVKKQQQQRLLDWLPLAPHTCVSSSPFCVSCAAGH